MTCTSAATSATTTNNKNRQHGVSRRRRKIQNTITPLSPDYFDNLRANGATNITRVKQLSTSIYQVTLESTSSEVGETYRLIDVNGFFPFTNGSSSVLGVANDAAAMLLAIYHFNNIQLSPILTVDDIGECNIRLTADLFDTETSPIATTRAITKVLQQNFQFDTPAPGGVVGALRSAETSPLALLTGVNDIAQVSYGSTSSLFDVKEQYPLFGRTVTNSDGEAAVAVKLFNSIGATHVGVLFITDAYGSALQKSFQDIASKSGLVTSSVAFSSSGDLNGQGIPNAIASLKNTQFRTIYAICYEVHYNAIMTAAANNGIVGNDYLWIFPGFELLTIFNQLSFPSGSPLIGATTGIGVLVFQGGVMFDSFVPGVDYVPPLQTNATSGFEKFRTAWRQAINDSFIESSFRSRIEPVLPNPVFDLEPSQLGALVYDAVLALGISMCRVGSNVSTFTGTDIFDELNQLDFEGASGMIMFENQSGTRDYTTLSFQLWNARHSETSNANGLHRFELVPTDYWQDSMWNTLPNQPFIYADGTTTPPQSLPPAFMNYNFIGEASRAVGYSLMGLVMIFSILSAVWSIMNRNERVVRSSQPLFLLVISVGTFIMASTIVPLSFDESIVSSQKGLDSACMASPVLYMVGSIMVFSVLYAKIRGVFQAYKDPELDFINVASVDMLRSFIVLLVINAAVFVPWTIVAPLQWHRNLGSANDSFGRKVDSYGACGNSKAWPFGALVLVFNLGTLIFANYRAFVCRNVETEYRESRYVSISLASILQAWCMGVPIAVVVWRNPTARFFVETAVVFITALGVLLLIYVPKVLAIRNDRRLALERSKKEAYNNFAQRIRRSDHDDDRLHGNGVTLTRSSPVSRQDSSTMKRETKTASTYEAEEKNEEESDFDGAYIDERELDHESKQPAGNLPARCEEETINVPSTKDQNVLVGDGETDASSPPTSAKGFPHKQTHHVPLNVPVFQLTHRATSTPVLAANPTATAEPVRGIKIVHNPRSLRNLLVTNGRELSREQFNEYLNYNDDEEEEAEVEEYDGINHSQINNLRHHDVNEAAAPQGDLLLDMDDFAAMNEG